MPVYFFFFAVSAWLNIRRSKVTFQMSINVEGITRPDQDRGQKETDKLTCTCPENCELYVLSAAAPLTLAKLNKPYTVL